MQEARKPGFLFYCNEAQFKRAENEEKGKGRSLAFAPYHFGSILWVWGGKGTSFDRAQFSSFVATTPTATTKSLFFYPAGNLWEALGGSANPRKELRLQSFFSSGRG